jgi:hypothetical protein
MGQEFSDFGSLDRGGGVLVPKSGIPCHGARAGQSPARRLSQGLVCRRCAHSTLQMSSGCPGGPVRLLQAPASARTWMLPPWSRTPHIFCSAAVVRPSVVRTSFAKSKGRSAENRPLPSSFTLSPLPVTLFVTSSPAAFHPTSSTACRPPIHTLSSSTCALVGQRVCLLSSTACCSADRRSAVSVSCISCE